LISEKILNNIRPRREIMKLTINKELIIEGLSPSAKNGVADFTLGWGGAGAGMYAGLQAAEANGANDTAEVLMHTVPGTALGALAGTTIANKIAPSKGK